MKYICPLITVEDIKVSRHFYETILQQKVKHDFGENIVFEGDFAIHLKSHFSELITNKTIIQPNNSFELYFEDNALDDLVNKLKQYKVEFIHDVREQPWRQRVARFYDPDKNIIEVGEPLTEV